MIKGGLLHLKARFVSRSNFFRLIIILLVENLDFLGLCMHNYDEKDFFILQI